MLSCKVSGSGMMSAAVGIDRGRVGERLQATLAGLQELHFLKEKQSDLVNWALRMDRAEPMCSTLTSTDGPRQGAEEQRLEATLTALKQQLSRLRRQDVGLKTHLQQLDQQISELKLDVSKASTEQLESDSRPSSGFYELSDGGSLSNSCTSVYSECLSSSQTSLLPPHHPSSPPHSSLLAPHPGVALPEAPRRLSADETAAAATSHPAPLRATGLHLGSSRIRVGVAGGERARQRPVSTGDLDRMLTPGLGYYKSVDLKKPSLCSNLRTSTVDPKFQNNLVSRGGTEVYHYPSPLHAVALQSPIFSLGGEPGATPATPESQGPPADRAGALRRERECAEEARPPGYIDKLLRRSASKISIQSEAGGRESAHTPLDYPAGVGAVRQDAPRVQARTPQQQQPAVQSDDLTPSDRKRPSVAHPNHRSYPDSTQTPRGPEISYRYSYPAAVREYNPAEAGGAVASSGKAACGDARESARPGRGERRPSVAQSSGAEEGPAGSEGGSGHGAVTAPVDFVRAQFVPAGSQRVKVRQADRKTKAVKLRRRSGGGEKPRAGRPQQGHSTPNERSREAGGGGGVARGEREPRGPSGKGRASQRLASCLEGEERWGCSGSESSLCGPGLPYSQRLRPQQHPQPVPAGKPGKARRPHCLEPEPLAEPRKRRQAAPRWPSDMDVFQAACVQRSRESVPGRGVSVRPHSAYWGGPPLPRSLQSSSSSSSSSSYFNSLNARYPPAPFPPSARYSSRCESEYSAECPSLFHSTIAESSEGELSDNTINRFGDSESSQSSQTPSESDGSASPDEGDQEEGGLVWAEAALGPTAAGLPLQQLPRPEPPACRIKASRALKKKIRRFQPASMKVMTLV